MNQGAAAAQWDQTSELMAMHANLNRDPSKQPSPYKSADFNPFDERGEIKQVQYESSSSVLERFSKTLKKELE